MASTKTEKHTLVHAGTPHDEVGYELTDPKVTKGTGRAKCSCGWLSEELDTAAARKSAHAEHKAEVAAEADAPKDAPSKGKKGSQGRGKAKADPTPEPDAPEAAEPSLEVTLDYRTVGPKHFWQAMRDVAVDYASEQDGVDGVKAGPRMTVVLSGDDGDALEETAAEVEKLWTEALAALTEHKKDKKASAKIWAGIAESRRAGRSAQEAFIKKFAKTWSPEGDEG